MDYVLDGHGIGVRFLAGARKFSPFHSDQTSPTQWISGALSPEVRQMEHEANHSPSSSAEVKNMWICTFTPTYSGCGAQLSTGTLPSAVTDREWI
jgi:hypothetical protein